MSAGTREGRGGLIAGLRRGFKGMKSGYVSGQRERLNEETEAAKRPRSKTSLAARILGVLLLVGVVAGVIAYKAPQLFRVRGVQTPVTVTLRPGVLSANVVQVQNLSHDHLANVVVTASRPGTSQSEARRLGTLAPGKVIELGGLEWNWVVRNGDSISVKADGYLPVVFSSDQLGR